MEYKGSNDEIYPTLPVPSAPQMDGGHNYRLQKIDEIQCFLGDIIEKRKVLSKKYHRAISSINYVDNALVVATMGLGVAGVGLLSTIIAAPVVVAMEATALGTSLLSLVGKFINKKLSLKAEKHEKIKILAEAKLNSVHDHIYKALIDNTISDEEFSLIVSEIEKFKQMKEDIKTKSK